MLADREALVLVLLYRSERDHGAWRLGELARQRFPHRFLELELRPLAADGAAARWPAAPPGPSCPEVVASCSPSAPAATRSSSRRRCATSSSAACSSRATAHWELDDRRRGADGADCSCRGRCRPGSTGFSRRHARSSASQPSSAATFGLPLLERLPIRTSSVPRRALRAAAPRPRRRGAPTAGARIPLPPRPRAGGRLRQPARRRRRRATPAGSGGARGCLVRMRANRSTAARPPLRRGRRAERAARYLLLAGDAARSVYASTEAIGHYRLARGFLARLGDERRPRETLFKIALVHHLDFRLRGGGDRLRRGVLVSGGGAGAARTDRTPGGDARPGWRHHPRGRLHQRDGGASRDRCSAGCCASTGPQRHAGVRGELPRLRETATNTCSSFAPAFAGATASRSPPTTSSTRGPGCERPVRVPPSSWRTSPRRRRSTTGRCGSPPRAAQLLPIPTHVARHLPVAPASVREAGRALARAGKPGDQRPLSARPGGSGGAPLASQSAVGGRTRQCARDHSDVSTAIGRPGAGDRDLARRALRPDAGRRPAARRRRGYGDRHRAPAMHDHSCLLRSSPADGPARRPGGDRRGAGHGSAVRSGGQRGHPCARGRVAASGDAGIHQPAAPSGTRSVGGPTYSRAPGIRAAPACRSWC